MSKLQFKINSEYPQNQSLSVETDTRTNVHVGVWAALSSLRMSFTGLAKHSLYGALWRHGPFTPILDRFFSSSEWYNVGFGTNCSASELKKKKKKEKNRKERKLNATLIFTTATLFQWLFIHFLFISYNCIFFKYFTSWLYILILTFLQLFFSFLFIYCLLIIIYCTK